jgi:acetylornithine deacetylase/succinyl-diaminopimelate desuccinylase-like protein
VYAAPQPRSATRNAVTPRGTRRIALDLARTYAYVDEHLDRWLDEVAAFCRIGSVGRDDAAMDAARRWLEAAFARLGAEVRSIPWDGAHPYVFAAVGAGPRSVLFFNHYDVADYTNPVREAPGERHPFSGERSGGKLYARGSADDKGTLLARMHAVEALAATTGLPLAARFLVEGKKGVSNKALEGFVAAHHAQLDSDCCLWEAGAKDERERQTISLGHKGNLYIDLVVRGTDRVWPSRYTLFPNPAWTLTWALASLKGPDERVLLPGFYDRVRPASDSDERLVYAHLADDTDALRERAGIAGFVAGVRGRDALRRLYGQPSLAICGIEGGARGAGQQLVLPAEARAKIEFRLVPDQDPDEVLASLRAHHDAHGFAEVGIEVQGRCPPYAIAADGWLPRLLLETAARVYPHGAVLTPVATGIGNRYAFARWTAMPIAGFAIGYAGYQIETNDEHIRVEDYREQVKWVATILAAVTER